MDFDFSDDEKLIRDQVARFLANRCPPSAVRAVLDGEATHDAELWSGLAELGLMGTALPANVGGVEAGYGALCLVAEQLGAHLAPVPFGSSVYLAAEALLNFGSAEQQQRWLPRIASGEVIGALAAVETLEQLTPSTVHCTAEGSGADTTLSGSKLIVADGGCAHLGVVLAQADAGLGLYLVDLGAAGVQRTAVATVDPSRDSARLDFQAAPAELLGAAGAGWAQLRQLEDRAAVLFAFEQLGGAQRALDMAVAYAQERYAFGRPIGSFQALKHMMADMYVALKLAESNCYYAAWALASNAPELPLAAATARVSATKAYQLCASDNIQVHGGMGFTWEFDCHLYYRRSNYLALQLGSLASWEHRLVDAVAAQPAAA